LIAPASHRNAAQSPSVERAGDAVVRKAPLLLILPFAVPAFAYWQTEQPTLETLNDRLSIISPLKGKPIANAHVGISDKRQNV
jgi:hypothetical protein